jgi:hypothetical protein
MSRQASSSPPFPKRMSTAEHRDILSAGPRQRGHVLCDVSTNCATHARWNACPHSSTAISSLHTRSRHIAHSWSSSSIPSLQSFAQRRHHSSKFDVMTQRPVILAYNGDGCKSQQDPCTMIKGSARANDQAVEYSTTVQVALAARWMGPVRRHVRLSAERVSEVRPCAFPHHNPRFASVSSYMTPFRLSHLPAPRHGRRLRHRDRLPRSRNRPQAVDATGAP